MTIATIMAFQEYRLTFFRQEQAGPLKQNNGGPAQN